eukprot:Hpha_TRINITY_DN16122_c1_g7::TRINITY_DN16122_c1_g7_i1::g.7274::m.7274
MDNDALAVLLFFLFAFILLGLIFAYLYYTGPATADDEGGADTCRLVKIDPEDIGEVLAPKATSRSFYRGGGKYPAKTRDLPMATKEVRPDDPEAAEVFDATAALRDAERKAWGEFEQGYEAAKRELLGKRAERQREAELLVILNEIEKGETKVRNQMELERDYKVACWYKNWDRWERWTDHAKKKTGSLGLKVGPLKKQIKQPQKRLIACRISDVVAEGAGSKAVLTRAGGEELPAGENKLKEGDLIVKVTVPSGINYEHNYKRAPPREAHYGGVDWPVFHREHHFMRALGVQGDVWEGTTFTLWVVRDTAFIEEFQKALDAYADTGGKFVKMNKFFDNPFPDGVTPPIPFPIPAQHQLLKAEVTMQERSVNAEGVLKRSLTKLQSFSSSGQIDVNKLYSIQSNDGEAKEYVRQLFDKFDENKNGKLELSEMLEVHSAIAQDCGINPRPRKEVEMHFAEADVNGDGRLDFDEFYFYLRDQIMEAMFQMEESMSRAAISANPQSSMIGSWEASGADIGQSAPLLGGK